jgi:hypothetical protein
MTDRRWIIVPNWQRFQHYGSIRRPLWIKNYLDLLHKDEYLDLPLATRGLLHGIWLAYADRDGRLREADLSSILLARARGAHLTSLNHAGLIDFSASKPLNLDLEKERARARARPEPDRRLQNARNWIQAGAAAEVPASHLERFLVEDFKIEPGSDMLGALIAQAQEWQKDE